MERSPEEIKGYLKTAHNMLVSLDEFLKRGYSGVGQGLYHAVARGDSLSRLREAMNVVREKYGETNRKTNASVWLPKSYRRKAPVSTLVVTSSETVGGAVKVALREAAKTGFNYRVTDNTPFHYWEWLVKPDGTVKAMAGSPDWKRVGNPDTTGRVRVKTKDAYGRVRYFRTFESALDYLNGLSYGDSLEVRVWLPARDGAWVEYDAESAAYIIGKYMV